VEETEVVSIRTSKSLKKEDKRLNINLKKALEDTRDWLQQYFGTKIT
jgi:hypothetical protein